MAKKSEKLQLILEFKKRGLESLDKAQKSVKSFTKSVTNLKKAAIGLGVGLLTGYGTTRIIQEFISASNVQAKAIASMETSLRSMGRYTPEVSRNFQKLASSLQAVTNYGDEATIAGIGMLVTYRGITNDLLPRTVKIMLDLAAKMGGDTVSAANTLGKASMGMTGELRRAGITVDEQTYKLKGYAGVLDEIAEQVEGQAEAQRLATGSWISVGNVIGDVKEKVGDFFKPATEPLATYLLDEIGKVDSRLGEFLQSNDFDVWANRAGSAFKTVGQIAVTAMEQAADVTTFWINLLGKLNAEFDRQDRIIRTRTIEDATIKLKEINQEIEKLKKESAGQTGYEVTPYNFEPGVDNPWITSHMSWVSFHGSEKTLRQIEKLEEDKQYLEAIIRRMERTALSSTISGKASSMLGSGGQATYGGLGALQPGALGAPEWVIDLAIKYGKKYNVDPRLVLSVIKTESNFKASAVSPKGAKGLMQLMPKTAEGLGVSDTFNPDENVDAGVRYLRSLLDRYAGSVTETLAAYNFGPGRVEPGGGIPLKAPQETVSYIDEVMKNYSSIGGDAKALAKSVAETEPALKKQADLKQRLIELSQKLAEEEKNLATAYRDIQTEVMSENTFEEKLAKDRQEFFNSQTDDLDAFHDRVITVVQDAAEREILIEKYKQNQLAQLRQFDQEQDRQSANQHRQILNSRLSMTQQVTQGMESAFTSLYDLSGQKSEEWFYLAKAAAIARAVMNTAEGATMAYAQGGAYGYILAAAVMAAGAMQIATISAQHLARGGLVGGHSPNDQADNVPAMLTAGEYVLPVSAAKYYGPQALEAMRSMMIPKEALELAGAVKNVRVPSSPSVNRFAYGGPVTSASNNARSMERSEIKIYNITDPSSMVQYLASPAGQNAVINVISANAETVRRIVK